MNRLTRIDINRPTDQSSAPATLTTAALATQNACFAGTRGVSQEGRRFGFLPAFLDSGTGEIYLSRFADGRPAPIHMLDGLPDKLVLARRAMRVTVVNASVIAGFVRDRRFYTREQAAMAARQGDTVRRH